MNTKTQHLRKIVIALCVAFIATTGTVNESSATSLPPPRNCRIKPPPRGLDRRCGIRYHTPHNTP